MILAALCAAPVGAGGAHELRVKIWNGAAYDLVIDDKVAAV